ncbi:alpha/beta hydrolase [Nocardioides marmoriginsengisoli]|uniref:Alpha/beta hydrolase n=1 Tax=Nocardioides marmoriginsengisoli TaxID=661483 RepID=A0A3N0CAN6_9ACTN|nr:alpha/beta hydrolase [Nocardioides marmoriginsengisoli]RNL60542.1 alpha/beta hydrolase [Nocardioides marmoriginsengisoli]
MVTTTTPPPYTPHPPSARARFAHWATRRTIRPLEHVVPDGELGVKVTRRVLATLMAGAGTTPAGVEVVPVDSTTESFGRIKGEWVRPATPRPGMVILYLHGSGYALCSTRTHRPLVSRLAKESRVTVFSAEYRLAPEHPFPAAPEDVERAYDWLLAQGWRPDQVVVAGDSAGGHLTLDLALVLLRAGRELPAGLVMFSPLADVTCTLIAEREQAIPDPMISAEGVRKLFAHYLLDTDPLHPRLTHVVAPGEVLPPTLIQAGGAEFLAADAHHIADMLATSGTDVRLEVWPGQMHVFQAANRMVPEADRALRRAARFLVTTLQARAAATAGNDHEVTA